MIGKMVLELKFGLMELNMKVNIRQGKKMEKEFCFLLMVQGMKALLLIMKLMAMAHINGQIKEFIQGNGKETKCMDMDKFLGQMAENI